MGRKTTIIALAMLATTLAGKASAECKLNLLGEIPLIMENGVPLVLGKIAGQDVLFLVDTSAAFSSLYPAAIAKYGLKTFEADGLRIVTPEGTKPATAARVPEFNFGQFRGRNGTFLVSEGQSKRIAGRIGQDYLAALDVEYDLANGMMRFFKPEGCAKELLGYWSPNGFSQATMDRVDTAGSRRLQGMIEVNGQRFRAWFSTVASTSVLSLEGAARAGLTPQSPGAQAAVRVSISDRQTWLVPVQSFGFGDETIKNTRLRIGEWSFQAPKESDTGSHISKEILEFPQMLIGTDYFLSHRIYVANSQGKIYFTYNGGGVFRRQPGQ